MSERYVHRFLSVLLLAVMVWAPGLSAGEGGAEVRVGYVIDDVEGNYAVSQETYNVYEGASLSIMDLDYAFDNGVLLTGDLRNITLNNRNLRFGVRKPGRFNLYAINDQYRRFYDREGSKFTRRRATAFKATGTINENFGVFAGFNRTDKHGATQEVLIPPVDTVMGLTDYAHTAYNFGGTMSCPYGRARVEYRHSMFDDRLEADRDRTADNFRLDLFSSVPSYERLKLASGYYYRTDELDGTDYKLTTNQGWFGAEWMLPKGYTVEYRLLFARTKHDLGVVETDNAINTLVLGKRFLDKGGVRLGYENRISDDLRNRTVSNGFLLNGWYNYQQRLFLKAMVVMRSADVKTGVTLVGDESVNRHRLSARYILPEWGDLTLVWLGRMRKFDDINSESDYNAITATVNMSRSEYGRVKLSHSYYLGTYENYSDETSYEFSDHLLTAALYPKQWNDFEGRFGATYYRSRRDQNIEKFSLNFGLTYLYRDDWKIEAAYDVVNFDDYLARGAYYTSNTIEISISKTISMR